MAPGPFLDGAEPCRRYAARIVNGPDGLVILGFADGGKDKFGGFVMDPEPVVAGPDGLLRVQPNTKTAG
jgi:beta-fructofuranosidase